MFVPGRNEWMPASACRSVSCTRSSARSGLPHRDMAKPRSFGTRRQHEFRDRGALMPTSSVQPVFHRSPAMPPLPSAKAATTIFSPVVPRNGVMPRTA